MSSNAENLRELSDAITSLNDDAIGMHELIKQGTSNLEETLKISKQASDELKKSNKAIREAVGSIVPELESLESSLKLFEEKSLKEAQETRNNVQTDIFNHKTAISARLDSLENEVIALKNSQKDLEEKIVHSNDEIRNSTKPILFIGVGVIVLEVVTIVVSILV